MTGKFDTFGDLLKGALGTRLSPVEDFLELFAQEVIFEFPYAPEGFPARLEGRDSLAKHLERLGPLLEFDSFELKTVYPSGDTVIFEFSCDGRGAETGNAYDQRYISVVTLRDGQIARYRDYWNPLIALSALGGQDRAAALEGGEAVHG